MLQYILRRILLFIPTLIIISLLAFIISVSAPGDPLSQMMSAAESGNVYQSPNPVQAEQQRLWTHRLGLDLPVFYFSVTPASFPDTLYRIYDDQERDALKSLLYRFGNWKLIENYHTALVKLLQAHHHIQPDSATGKNFTSDKVRQAITRSYLLSLSLMSSSSVQVIASKLDTETVLCAKYPFLSTLSPLTSEIHRHFTLLQENGTPYKNWWPAFQFHPVNQYERWLFGDGNWLTGRGSINSKGLIRGDLGLSLTTGMPVSRIIWQHIGWSFLLTMLSVILSYLISVPVGIRAAVKAGSSFDRWSSIILFILHSMPAFWVATLLLILFANPDFLPWFPASGVKPAAGYPSTSSLPEKVFISFPYLVLPVIAYTYSSLAFLARLTRGTMLEVLHQDFIRTARAKGLSEHQVIYRHAFRNALLPLITVFANILPAVLAGSVILESIFSIPGMGLETFRAIQNQDYPMIVGVFTLTGVMTLIGYLIADILYAAADPRISFSKR